MDGSEKLLGIGHSPFATEPLVFLAVRINPISWANFVLENGLESYVTVARKFCYIDGFPLIFTKPLRKGYYEG